MARAQPIYTSMYMYMYNMTCKNTNLVHTACMWRSGCQREYQHIFSVPKDG